MLMLILGACLPARERGPTCLQSKVAISPVLSSPALQAHRRALAQLEAPESQSATLVHTRIRAAKLSPEFQADLQPASTGLALAFQPVKASK